MASWISCTAYACSWFDIVYCIENELILKYHFLQRAHSTEQAPLTRVFPSGTHLSAESTEAMWIECLAQGHNTDETWV